MKPQVSVILPTYNRAHLIERAVRSVLDPSFEDVEVIVVDDGSTDDTPDVIARIKDARVRYVRLDENEGAARARNLAIEAARAPWLAFQDSDDEWLPGKLAAQMEHLENAGSDGCFGQGIMHHGARSWTAPQGFDPARRPLPQVLLRTNVIPMATSIVRRDAVLAAGGFDEALPRLQDWDLWLRVVEHAELSYMGQPLARQHLE